MEEVILPLFLALRSSHLECWGQLWALQYRRGIKPGESPIKSSSIRRGWERRGCSGWRREGSEGSHHCVQIPEGRMQKGHFAGLAEEAAGTKKHRRSGNAVIVWYWPSMPRPGPVGVPTWAGIGTDGSRGPFECQTFSDSVTFGARSLAFSKGCRWLWPWPQWTGSCGSAEMGQPDTAEGHWAHCIHTSLQGLVCSPDMSPHSPAWWLLLHRFYIFLFRFSKIKWPGKTTWWILWFQNLGEI